MPLVHRIFRIFAILAIFACVGCGAANVGETANQPKPLASYGGKLAELFDDRIVAAAVGVDLEHTYTAKSDKRLRERVEAAEGILRVRIATVTGKVAETGTSYILGMKALETIRGKFSSNFTVTVPSRGESAAILRNFDTRLVGKTFIVFVREFVRPDGDTEIHFHCLPDTEDSKNAIVDSTSFETAVRGANFR